MNTKYGKLLLLSVVAGSFLFLGTGCGKKSVVAPESSAGSGKDNMNYPASEGGYNENSLPTMGSLDDSKRKGKGGLMGDENQSDEYKRVHGRCSEGFSPIYFDYDQAGIRADMRDRMVQNAKNMQQGSGSVVVEGNTDSRGTNEYNMALGERRAQNAKDYLIRLGISASKIRTVSYGEERPLFEGQSEDAYAQNRRDDFIAE